MKTNNLIFSICSLFISSLTFSQLRVDPSGRIGLGTLWPNNGYQCHIESSRNALLMGVPTGSPFVELQFKIDHPECIIGSTNGAIAFWEHWTGFNTINVGGVNVISDSNLKTNILPLEKGLDKIMTIKSYRYNIGFNYYDSLGQKTSLLKTNYGFLSQQIERELGEVDITTNRHGVKLMDYNQILPVVVKATQEQQQTIESLQKELEELKIELEKIKNQGINNSKQNNSTNSTDNKAQFVKNILYQNNPNPFNESTSIKYKVEKENFKSGSILIFDMNGTLLKTYPIRSGNNEIKINGSELKSGMYIYSLIVNDKEIDTKRMILSK